MRTVFLDTVGLIALWDTSDQWHAAAETAFLSLQASPVRFVTSSMVLYECGNASARRPYRKYAADLRVALESSGDLLIPTPSQESRAWAEYAIGPIGSAGAVDNVSFVLMENAGIVEAFTNDVHFRTAGLVTLF
jgi:uncharacterized protein